MNTATVLLNMNKAIIILAFLVIVLAYSEATKDRCAPACHKNVRSKIRCVRDGRICRKMRQCTVQEINCRRSHSDHRRLIPTSSSLCRNIKGPLGSGRCASIRKPRSTRSDCKKIRCTESSKKLGCYRSKKNNCRLLTSCQLRRVNCRRGSKNVLRRTDRHACSGLKKPSRKQRCRPIPKKD